MKQGQTEHTHQNVWDLIDGVLVVNLEHRTDRWEQVLQTAEGIIPPDKMHRVPAVLGKNLDSFGKPPWFRGGKRDAAWAARAGCTLSHRQAMETALQNGWKTFLILEDDIEFVPDFDELNSALVTSLITHKEEWDVCYLGYTDPWGPFRELGTIGKSNTLFQIFGCLTTHAYLITDSAAKTLLAKLPEERTIWPWLSTHRAIDRWYLRNMGLTLSVTCISPSIVNQYADYSDILMRKADLSEHDKHATAVPRDQVSSTSFKWKYLLQKWKSYPLRLSDIIRGQLKRWRGF